MTSPAEMSLPPSPQAKGFFTDATVCIGCKACEVACKQWNQLPDDGFRFTGMSYDNTGALGATTWRHVAFFERTIAETATSTDGDGQGPQMTWAMMSDVCKHCARAGCLEACPTGAIIRTELGSVYIQPDICNGCGYCISACPFGVVARSHEDGRAFKCTLCYDRLKEGMEPACAKACPTDSIVFGDVVDLVAMAKARVETLHRRGVTEAYLYGAEAEDQPGTQGLHAFFLLTHEPEAYNLPPDPIVPTKHAAEAWWAAVAGAAGMALLAMSAVAFGRRA
jgi:formate dehydrogenase iron-sulfur subunit